MAVQCVGDPALQVLRQPVVFHVQQARVVEHVVLEGCPQGLQEVDPALAAGGREGGEPLVADVQRVAVLALVPGDRVVGLEVPRDLAGGRQQLVLLPVEQIVSLG